MGSFRVMEILTEVKANFYEGTGTEENPGEREYSDRGI